MLKCTLALLIFSFLLSCGKKESSNKVAALPPELLETEKEELLKKQEILCEPGTFCPDYVTKIVVFDRGQVRYCTGTLISKSKVVTSASCLPNYLRSVDADCSRDVFFFFNRGSRTPERLKCKSILQVSELDGNQSEYWRDDVAVLELERNLNWREYKNVSRKGFRDGESYRFFGVEQSNEFIGVIKKEECEAVLGSYLYPLSSKESSPNILLAGCSRKNGYRGAAILDNMPRIRAVLSDNDTLGTQLESSDLLIKPLKKFIHATNFACAPLLDETSRLDEVECAKVLNYSMITDERTRLLSDETRFGNIVTSLERLADNSNSYLRLSVRLTPVENRQVLDFSPVCFKGVSDWLPEIDDDGSFNFQSSLPSITLRKGVDSYGRAITQELEGKQTMYFFNFSPKRLKKEKLSDVFVDTDATDRVRVSAIKACTSLF